MNLKSIMILPQLEINRTLPSENKSEKISYVGKTMEVRLINYGKAYINSKGFVIRGVKLMKDTNTGPKLNFNQKQKLAVSLYFKSKIKDFKDKTLITIADGFTTCYYHWMCDHLIRLNLVRENIKDDFLLVLPKGIYESNFCVKSLEMLGINKDRIIVIDKREVAKSNQVIFPTSIMGGSLKQTSYDPEIIKIRDQLLSYCKIHNKLNFNLGNKIFISRSKQKKRIILNQKEVDELLLKHGFSIVNMEDLSFEDGIAAAYNAKYIIGQCSSGLTNIMFAQKGTKVLELYPKKSYGDINGGTWFSEMSQAADLEHSYQYCEIDSKNIYINEFHTNMIVDLEKLEKNIIKLSLY